MNLSIVVVTWNSAEELPACLASIRGAVPSTEAEIIVVDNGSVDNSREIAVAAGARVIELHENRGFPIAVNAGVAVATAPYVLLLNPDVRLDSGAIGTCLAVLTRDLSVGVVGANLRRIDGSPDPHAARRSRTLWLLALECTGITRLLGSHNPMYVKDRTRSREVPSINGAFMLMRTKTLRELGGLDERVFMYLEDQELCRRLHERGLRVWFEATAGATHLGGATTQRADLRAQATAYLHRLDADVTMAESRYGWVGRCIAVLLLLTQSFVGVAASAMTSRELVPRYRQAIRWLVTQPVARRRPPRVGG